MVIMFKDIEEKLQKMFQEREKKELPTTFLKTIK